MFVYSLKASSIKFVIVLVLCVCAIVLLFTLTGTADEAVTVAGQEINYGGMKTNEDRVAFIEQFGLKVDGEPIEEQPFSIPENFDRVIAGYNEIQKTQGLDLAKYKGKRVTRYTYRATNYDFEGDVNVNLLVYKGRIIGCDLSSADPLGFVTSLVTLDAEMLTER
ncbi:MAG: DUF4830 domain-containing protein [Clostridia bacterium]|nr:DUF4830 domain-containing protein [Clostridia bacterium]